MKFGADKLIQNHKSKKQLEVKVKIQGQNRHIESLQIVVALLPFAVSCPV